MEPQSEERPLPPAFGTDRVRVAREGFYVFSLYDKGWQARSAPVRSGRQHPGTAIEWDGSLWEVVTRRRRSRGGLRYRLVPWKDDHVVRFRDRYDAAREIELAKQREAARVSRTVRRSLWLTGWFLGHLPAAVQMRIAGDHGTSQSTPTYMSILPLWCIGVVALVFFIPSMLGAPSPLPPPLMALGLYWFVESAARFAWISATGEPIGSVFGAIAWAIHRRWKMRSAASGDSALTN